MQYNVHTAKSQLSKLIEEAMAGEDVVIAKNEKPMVRLVPVERKPFLFGTMADKLKGPLPDFLEPMSEEELLDWEGRD